MRKTKTFIKRTKDFKIVWYQLTCHQDSSDYNEAKQYAKNKGLNYVHRDGYLFIEADGATPDTLKEYGYKSLEGFYNHILGMEDTNDAYERIKTLNQKQTKVLYEQIKKEEKQTAKLKTLHDLCFSHLYDLSK